MVPTPGRIVLYRLTEDDAKRITHQRTRTGITGNPADVADLRVLPDGQDPPPWAASRRQGGEPGTWSWPVQA